MDDTHELMTVGRFAAASGLSARALRLYDAAGLLAPDETDEASGYRRYGLRQLGRARLIRLLREGDVPLELVARLLDASADAQIGTLDQHERVLEAEHASRLAALAEARSC